jgi:hypothetical protein
MLEDMSMRRFVPDTQREYIGAGRFVPTDSCTPAKQQN